MADYQPRIDEHGVGWCSRKSCPQFRDGRHWVCLLITSVGGWLREGSTICEPWARDTAKDHRAMDVLRSGRISDVVIHGDGTSVFYPPRGWTEAKNPVDAILKAAGESEVK